MCRNPYGIRASTLNPQIKRWRPDIAYDQAAYLSRKAKVLDQRATVASRKAQIESGYDTSRIRIQENIELVKALGNIPDLPNDDELRDLLKITTSNFGACGKNIVIAWANPFNRLLPGHPVTSGEPSRIKPRTSSTNVSRVLVQHIKSQIDETHRNDEKVDKLIAEGLAYLKTLAHRSKARAHARGDQLAY
jgi:hypothetical protein